MRNSTHNVPTMVLEKRGLHRRKGSSETFMAEGRQGYVNDYCSHTGG